MKQGLRPWLRLAAVLAVAMAVGACTSPRNRAPVEERVGSVRPPVATKDPQMVKAMPGAENAGKPGYYTIKPGDTLIRLGLDTGQPWRDIARWNNIDNPNLIEVGQVLRVVRPGTEPEVLAVRPVAGPGKIDARALDGKAEAKPVPPAASAAASSAGPALDDDVAWAWPASGAVVGAFDEVNRKGLVISGKAGDPVLAAANGRVVYVGSDLRGYGNLVIIKHNNTYLSAYAHNQVLLVKEEQVVRKGQKIAEMGSTDADRVQLHFEIRRLGKPVDPAKFLPAR